MVIEKIERGVGVETVNLEGHKRIGALITTEVVAVY